MAKRKQRPIDVKDVMWSHIGKDELDRAAELVWNTMRDAEVLHTERGGDMGPYHVQSSTAQAAAQRAVLAIFGTTVPTLLRDFIDYEDMPKDAKLALRKLADDLEEEHSV